MYLINLFQSVASARYTWYVQRAMCNIDANDPIAIVQSLAKQFNVPMHAPATQIKISNQKTMWYRGRLHILWKILRRPYVIPRLIHVKTILQAHTYIYMLFIFIAVISYKRRACKFCNQRNCSLKKNISHKAKH